MGICLGKPAETPPPNHFCANERLADPLEVLHQSSLSSHGLKCYSFAELKIATQKFSSHTLVGVGSYGSVFKGWIDQKTLAPSKPGVGVVVAVKMFTTKLYGLDQDWESDAKCLELGQRQHTNLVRLIGYCLMSSEKRFLVYEFMPNGSLGNHLFEGGEVMSWSVRMRIAVGVARGLCFLHSLGEHVVYREDLSTENILLDSDFNAKLSDFGHTPFSGHAKFMNLHHQWTCTSRKRFGSQEQILTGQTTQKSDVYGFGVVLLELLSGQKLWGPVRELIMNRATPLVTIMDPKLLDVYPIEDAKAALTIAYQCVHSRPTTRPTMAHVLSELENLLN